MSGVFSVALSTNINGTMFDKFDLYIPTYHVINLISYVLTAMTSVFASHLSSSKEVAVTKKF